MTVKVYGDRELSTILAMFRMLEQYNIEERLRMLDYLCRRYEVEDSSEA